MNLERRLERLEQAADSGPDRGPQAGGGFAKAVAWETPDEAERRIAALRERLETGRGRHSERVVELLRDELAEAEAALALLREAEKLRRATEPGDVED